MGRGGAHLFKADSHPPASAALGPRAVINLRGVSSPGEFHPRALVEPGVNLSAHRGSHYPALKGFVSSDGFVPPIPMVDLPTQTWVTHPLRSTPITGASPLLRDGPSPCPATGTQSLTDLLLGTLPLDTALPTNDACWRADMRHFRGDRFPRSAQEPEPGSRHLHAGHHPGSTQAPPGLIPRLGYDPGFDAVSIIWVRLF
jgi:hypothetical protein